MQKVVLSLTACLCLLVPGAALAAASGVARGVNPDASAKTGSDTRTLVVGADIFMGDVVKTGPSGQVQIKFSDNTELVVGPRSSLTIEDYLLREDGSAGKLVVNTLAGTFRFVTGNAPKDRYLIKTPTGTIGVRGTAFDWANTSRGTAAMLYHGAIEVCTAGGTCVLLEDVCDVAEYDSSQAQLLGHFDNVTGDARNLFRSLFVYAVNQNPLLREFRITGVERCVNRQSTPGGPNSLVDPVTGQPVTPQGGGIVINRRK
ncbi:MAG TPA: FecR family protein [Devosia sp.]